MAITKDFGRQCVECAMVDINLADITAGVAAPAIALPPGAIVVGGDIVTTTAFNSTSTDTLAVGDSATGNRYLAAGNIHATGRVALVPTGYTSAGETISVTWASGGGTPTTGKVRLSVQYVIVGRAETTFG